jgi:hypothetical protein
MNYLINFFKNILPKSIKNVPLPLPKTIARAGAGAVAVAIYSEYKTEILITTSIIVILSIYNKTK